MKKRILTVIVAALAVLTLGIGSAVAAPPSPSGAIVLGFEPAEPLTGAESVLGLRTSDRCPLGEGRVQVFYAEGRPAGTASICFVRAIGAPYVVFYSAVITVNLAGGSVTATIGTSLTFNSGFPDYADPATGTCVYAYGFGGGNGWFEAMSCAGPITAATGVFSQASSGWLALTWARGGVEEIGAEEVWTTRPTITITFS
jgi:hypothetical protein